MNEVVQQITNKFPESTTRTQLVTITIPKLKELASVTVSSGRAEVVGVVGEEVTLRLTSGSYTRRERGGGNYTPADSKVATGTRKDTEANYRRVIEDGRGGKTTEFWYWRTWDAPSSIDYNSGGYSGVLNRGERSYIGIHYTPNFEGIVNGSYIGEGVTYYEKQWIVNYSGTVTRPGSDTRWYYYYYQYEVTINYEEKGFELRVKQGDQLRISTEGWVKVNGELRLIEYMYTKIDGKIKVIE